MGKSKKTDPDEHKVVELEEMNIFLRIPKETVALEVTASLLDGDGKIMKVSAQLSVSDIRNCRQDFLDNVENGDDYNPKYVLTDKGRDYLDIRNMRNVLLEESLIEEQRDEEDDIK